MLSPELQFLIACCAPPGEVAGRVNDALKRPLDWRLLIDDYDAQGMLPLISRAMHFAGEVAVQPEFLQEIHDKAGRKRLRSLGMAGELARVLRALEGAGLTAIAFKGPTLAYLAYGDVAMRDATDLDIYVPRHQLAAALNLLAVLGYREKSAGFKATLAGACEVALKRQNPESEIDLHWQFSPPYFLQFDAERAIARSITVQAAGFVARTLCPDDLLRYLCIHAARECWSIRSVCDVAALLRTQSLQWETVLKEASDGHSWRALAVGLRLAAIILDAPVPADVRRRVDRDTAVRSIADRFATSFSGTAGVSAGAPSGAILHLRMLETARSRARYLWRRAVQPNHLDADFIRLPDGITPAYYVVRPFRVACAALGLLRPH